MARFSNPRGEIKSDCLLVFLFSEPPSSKGGRGGGWRPPRTPGIYGSVRAVMHSTDLMVHHKSSGYKNFQEQSSRRWSMFHLVFGNPMRNIWCKILSFGIPTYNIGLYSACKNKSIWIFEFNFIVLELKHGFCKKSLRKDAPLTSWKLYSSKKGTCSTT